MVPQTSNLSKINVCIVVTYFVACIV